MTVNQCIEQLNDLRQDKDRFYKTKYPDGADTDKLVKDIQALDIAIDIIQEYQNEKRQAMLQAPILQRSKNE